MVYDIGGHVVLMQSLKKIRSLRYPGVKQNVSRNWKGNLL
jgi:hypothetical protein